MDKLDPISQVFITYAMRTIEDPVVFRDFAKERVREAANFFSRNPDEIRRMLRDKLILGSLEHGSPIMDLETVETEKEKEYLDMLGWTLVGMFNKERLKNGR